MRYMPTSPSGSMPSSSLREWALRESVVDRFLRYVRFDTQSAEDQATTPSTAKQWDLARMLAAELEALGARDVRVSEHAMVYAIIPATVLDTGPTVGFLAHIDTSPAVTGTGVRPIVHTGYRGGDIVLPNDPSQVIAVAQNPDLATLVGDDIITTDGTTLLGSDDKAGVAAIMTLADVLLANPAIPHGPVAVAFTCDEEIGVGIDKFDIAAFGARYAYTVDGGRLGEINDETWSACTATVTFRGKSTHPGTAKGVMVNAIHALAAFVARLPRDMLPETTEGRVGFVHPYVGTADVETSTLKVLLRDFDRTGLDAKEALLRELVTETERRCPGATVELELQEDYQNMREVLAEHPQLVEYAMEAARRAGVEPFLAPIRGGTDGAKLTFRGLPCPNLFTGGHNFHGKLEWNSRRGLEKTAETLVHLVQLFGERTGE
jgi:tripeptide aminopeptidase